MKVLVIPDIHGRKFWREAIKNYSEQVDKIIFLGDYLDPYSNEIEENQELMECNDFYDCVGLSNMLNDIISLKKNELDKYILLTGNHTDSYIWSKFHAATRTDYRNWEKYHKIFLENLNLFNLIWVENNVIFSHAGISEDWARVYCASNNIKFSSILDTAKILQNLSLKTYNHTIGNISYYRGGDYNHGSCEWADLREHVDMEKSTIDKIVPKGDSNIFQVFGHTQLKAPLITDKWDCIDCRKGFIFDTDTFSIEDGSDNSL